MESRSPVSCGAAADIVVCRLEQLRHGRCSRPIPFSAGTPSLRVSTFTMTKAPSLSRFAKAALSLEVFLSVGALGGGAALMVGPRGEIIPLPLSALSGSPFKTYFVPGLVLFCVLGFCPLVAARLAWLRHPLASMAALGVGVLLLIWMTVEIVIVGYSNMTPRTL